MTDDQIATLRALADSATAQLNTSGVPLARLFIDRAGAKALRAALALARHRADVRREVWDYAIGVARAEASATVQDMTAGPVPYHGAEAMLEALVEARRADLGETNDGA